MNNDNLMFLKKNKNSNNLTQKKLILAFKAKFPPKKEG